MIDPKKRFVGGLVGLILGAQVLSMSGCASMKTHMLGGTKTPNYEQIKNKGLEKVDSIRDLNKNKQDYKKKYVEVWGTIITSCFPEEAKKDYYMCTPLLGENSIPDDNQDGKIDKKERDEMVPVYISGENPGVLKLLYEFAQAKDKIGLIGKFSYGKHVLYDNEWGIELTHLIYFDDKLGEKRYLNLNYADEEKIKGWLEDLKSGKALGKGLERGVKSAF